MSGIKRSGGSGGPTVAWSYIPLTMPTGASAAEAQWQFDATASDLLDRTANGHDLSLTAGTTMHSCCSEGLIGHDFNGTTCYTAALPTNLRITGALTIEILHRQDQRNAAEGIYFCCGVNNELETGNFLYKVSVSQAIYFFSEHGAGVNDLVTFKWGALAGQMSLMTITRSAAGAYCLYLNGVLVESGSMTPPTGGSLAIVQIGDSTGFLSQLYGKIYSLRVSKQVLTAAQVLEVYNDCRA